jgi:predicted HicB family RNase H-like nuclease
MQMDRRLSDAKTTLWLPRRLHRAVKRHAAAHGMSMRSVVIAALDAFLNPRREGPR